MTPEKAISIKTFAQTWISKVVSKKKDYCRRLNNIKESAMCEANSNAVLGDVSGGINTIILREVQILNFGQALEQLKLGSKVAREGWNGKDMYLYKANQELPYPPLADGEKWEEGVFEKSEFIVMKTADKKLIPWLASQTDLLAEDWTIVV